MGIAKFVAGSRTYVCSTCLRNTRLNNPDQSSNATDCSDCHELQGFLNAVYDGEFDASMKAEADRLLQSIEEKGGDMNRVRKDFAELIAASAEIVA